MTSSFSTQTKYKDMCLKQLSACFQVQSPEVKRHSHQGKNRNQVPHKKAKCQWLMPVILAIKEAEIRRIPVQSQTRHTRSYLEKAHHNKGMVEWVKV
jgi:hypothetical protein